MMIVMIYESHVDDDDGSDNGFAVVVSKVDDKRDGKEISHLFIGGGGG